MVPAEGIRVKIALQVVSTYRMIDSAYTPLYQLQNPSMVLV